MLLNTKLIQIVRDESLSVYKEAIKDRLIYLLILVMVLSISIFTFYYDYTNQLRFFSYFHALGFIIPISTLLYVIFYYFKRLINREPQPIKCFNNPLALVYASRTKLLSSFLLLTAISLFMSCFSTMKNMIPIVNMFKYDVLFQELDRWFFLGHDPALFIHRLIESPYGIFIMDLCYNLWFFIMWTVICYFLLASNSVVRTRFLISTILCWSIIGIVIAMLLSSAGPAFVPRLNPENHAYDLLIQTLENKHNWLIEQGWPGLSSLSMQNNLWDAYANNKDMLGSGISAMPSMHVSVAVLMALAISSVNQKLGYALWVFAFIIFIGSFALGWHYFVDGIVSALLTLCIWRISSYVSETDRQVICTTRISE